MQRAGTKPPRGHLTPIALSLVGDFMTDLTYRRASAPQRWFLALVFMCVIGLTVAMMVRVVELKPGLDRVGVEDDDEAPRVPLPAGPRRFQ